MFTSYTWFADGGGCSVLCSTAYALSTFWPVVSKIIPPFLFKYFIFVKFFFVKIVPNDERSVEVTVL